MSNNQKPVINIITRTSGRPNYFKACQQSILKQTYPSDRIRCYVAWDNETDVDGSSAYIGNYNNLYQAYEVTPQSRKNQSHFPYHAYLNEILNDHIAKDPTATGWILILDDDNVLAKVDSLEILSKQIMANKQDPNKLYIWKCQQPHRVVPSQLSFNKVPKVGDVQISCFAFHMSQIKYFKIEDKKGAEAETISKLFNQLNCVWIDNILTQTGVSGNGTRKDLTETTLDNRTKITLKPIIKPVISLTKPTITLKPTIQVNKPLPTPILEVVEEHEDENDDEDEFDENDNEDELDENDNEDELDENECDEDDTNECEDEDDINECDEDEEEIADEDDHIDPDEEEISNEEPTPVINTPIVPTPIATELMATTAELNNLGTETTQLLIRLVNVLKTGRKVYILDENNMKKLSQCLFDAITCVDMEDQLVKALETNLFKHKTQELKHKVQEALMAPSPTPTPTLTINKSISKPTTTLPISSKTKLSPLSTPVPIVETTYNDQNAFIDLIYMLIDGDAKNVVFERNQKILKQGGFECEIIKCRDLNLYNYQNQIRDILKTAKGQGYRRIMILNGNNILNNKFAELYQKQLAKMSGDCYLWFLGQFKDTSSREMLSTEFDLDDYLSLYEDISKAKMTTQDKAHLHWKNYGHREGRYAKINILNNPTTVINNNYGVVVGAELYDTLIDLIDKQSIRDCKDVFTLIQKNLVDSKTIWYCRPDLIIPALPNPNNHTKNEQLLQRCGCYYNFFKM